MERIEYRHLDKSKWARGPWDNEPDKVQWQDEATGLPCLIVRGFHGALCGYVGVSEGHPLFQKGYSECLQGENCSERKEGSTYHWCNHRPESVCEVHGGLTYADGCQPDTEEDRGICHKPAEGEPDHVWWFGFDCAHAGDLTPAYDWRSGLLFDKDIYRDVEYVKGECESLAKQLKNLQSV